MNEFPIKIGRRIKILDWIGWSCLIISIVTLLILGALFLIGTLSPAEISIAYYHEILTTNYLVFLLSAIGLLTIGYKLSVFRYYSPANLILNQNNIKLSSNDNITLLTYDLIQQIEILDDKEAHITIITNNFVRRFPIKGSSELAKALNNEYPEKIKKRATTLNKANT